MREDLADDFAHPIRRDALIARVKAVVHLRGLERRRQAALVQQPQRLVGLANHAGDFTRVARVHVQAGWQEVADEAFAQGMEQGRLPRMTAADAPDANSAHVRMPGLGPLAMMAAGFGGRL